MFDPPKPIKIQSVEMVLIGTSELRLSGSLSTPLVYDEIEKHLRALDVAIVRAARHEFTVDVRALGFANSSAIRLFVAWSSRAERGGYKLIFLTDRRNVWQRLSFSALKAMAPNHVDVIEGEGSASPPAS